MRVNEIDKEITLESEYFIKGKDTLIPYVSMDWGLWKAAHRGRISFDERLSEYIDNAGGQASEGHMNMWTRFKKNHGIKNMSTDEKEETFLYQKMRNMKKWEYPKLEEALNEFTISDLKYMGITHITPEQKKELQKISHENNGNITRSDLKKVGLLLQTRHVREEECSACNGTGWERVSSDEDERGCDECGGTGEIEELNELWPALAVAGAAGYGLYKGGKAVGKWLAKKNKPTADMLPGDGLIKQAGVAVQNRKNQMNKNLAALKNEDAMSAEEIGKYPDLGWTNVNDTQEVKTYLNNMPHTPRVKIETFRQRVTEPHFQKFLKKYMTDHPDEPYDSVDSKPVTTNAPVKGHHNEDAVSDQVKGSDPMPKAKPGRTDHPYRGKLVGSKYDEEVVNEESGISRFNKEDPNNPEVMIQGYGSLLLNQIEDDLVRNFNSLEHMAKRKEWDGIDYQLNKTGVMQAKLEAIITTKEQLQSIRRKGGPKSRGITKESLYDILVGEDKMDALDESFEKLSRKFQVAKNKKAYKSAADTLHEVLKRKYEENEGNWRHALGWYVSKIASGFNGVKTRVLEDYYLENYESAFIESVTETGGVGRVVPGVNTSVDVGPNEIKKQAAKFGNTVDKDGLPKKTFR